MSETQRIVANVTVIQTPAQGEDAGWQFIYAPGAGSHVDDPFGVYTCATLAARGVSSARFQFPYQEARSRRPDRPAVLQETWLGVLDAVRRSGLHTVIGGRSMGGRVATMIVAGGASVDGLVPFAYPLHPPGHPENARVGHLPDIKSPSLFVSGTRDTFGTPDKLTDAVGLIKGAKLHWLDGADHGFAVLKHSNRTKDEVYQEAVDALTDWAKETLSAHRT